ncbi:MAG TPA: hypothetical protein VNR60_06985 [Croceibacterium sp.]|nr:hypothetical protein [Croceibacterium sp.]
MSDTAPPTPGEVRALAHQLLTWAEQLSALPPRVAALSDDDRHEFVLSRAETLRREARLRARLFPGVPFGNANWDLALELFVREMAGFRVSLEDLAGDDILPREVIVRCVDSLAELGFVDQVSDRFDSRISWISLSDAGKKSMTRFLLESARSSGSLHESSALAVSPENHESDPEIRTMPFSRSA